MDKLQQEKGQVKELFEYSELRDDDMLTYTILAVTPICMGVWKPLKFYAKKLCVNFSEKELQH